MTRTLLNRSCHQAFRSLLRSSDLARLRPSSASFAVITMAWATILIGAA